MANLMKIAMFALRIIGSTAIYILTIGALYYRRLEETSGKEFLLWNVHALDILILVSGAFLSWLLVPMQSAGESTKLKSRLMGIRLYILIFALTYVFPFIIILVVPTALMVIIGGIYHAAKFGTLDYKGPANDVAPDYDIAELKGFYEKSILPDLKMLAEKYKSFLERHNKSNSLSSLPFFCGAALGFYLLYMLIRLTPVSLGVRQKCW